jgi:hypothetical protein
VIGDFETEPSLDSMKIGNEYFESFPTENGFASQDILISKYTSGGEYLWTHVVGGNKDDYGYSISTNAQNEIYFTCSVRDSLIRSDIDLEYYGAYDAIFGKLTSNG